MALVDDHVGLDALLSRHAADADIGAHRVQIRVFVSHDEDVGGIPHQFCQGVGHDAGFDLRALFDLKAAPAEELKAEAVLDDGLVTAARDGKLCPDIGKLQALFQAAGILAEADADAGRDAAGVFHLVHLRHDRKLIPAHLVKVLFLEHREIPVSVITAENPVVFLAPPVKAFFHVFADIVLDAVGIVAHQFIQIVQHDHSRDRA